MSNTGFQCLMITVLDLPIRFPSGTQKEWWTIKLTCLDILMENTKKHLMCVLTKCIECII